MAPDDRTYIKVHDGIEDHPKIAPLSDKAFRLLVTTWGWCSRHRTDGRVPNAIWAARGTKRARAELVSAGLAEVRDDHVLMHDYLQHQRSAKEISDKLDAKRRASLLANHQRWHVNQRVREATCELCRSEGTAGEDTRPLSLVDSAPDPSRDPKRSPAGHPAESTETEVEVHKGKTSSSTASRSKVNDPDFDRFWEVYPRKVGKGEARKAWARIVKTVDPELVIAGAVRYRDDPMRRRNEAKFTKHPGPWLNAERWTDQLNGNDLVVTNAAAWWNN